MGVVLHAMPNNICDFMEFAIVHFKEGVQNSTLYWLKAIVQFRNCPVHNYIRGIVEEVFG
ncbi:MAG: hypothetical protein BWX44_01072 [Spirochaetes bacterium ADurb.Bin001]|nr:MAG: hypothetical protein BWX44_01072 [Spirochaetes bacterium ADurb.Bin001]